MSPKVPDKKPAINNPSTESIQHSYVPPTTIKPQMPVIPKPSIQKKDS